MQLTLTPDTAPEEMAAFNGLRVRIDNRAAYANHPDPRERDRIERGLAHAEQVGRLTSAPRHMNLFPGIGADIVEDAHGTCRGGHTATYIPYGATITALADA